MSPVWVVPERVPAAAVRRLDTSDDLQVPIQKVDVQRVPPAHVVPRQIDPVGLRLMALQLENDELRAKVEQLTA